MSELDDVKAYCASLPGTMEDRPFGGDIVVFRHHANQKVFVFFLYAHGKLHINLKCSPMEADFLRRAFRGVTAGYHMNKQHWNSVFLGEDVPMDEVFRMVDVSYELTRPKLKRRKQEK